MGHRGYITLLLLLMHAFAVTAQDEVPNAYDNRSVFNHLDDERMPLWLMASLDTLEYGNNPHTNIAPTAEYALGRSISRRRGLDFDQQRYIVDGLAIDYTTARHLARLGASYERGEGLSLMQYSGATAQTTLYSLSGTNDHRYEGHSLRGSFATKGYLLGADYTFSKKLGRGDISLKRGWRLTVDGSVRTGRDLYIEGVYANQASVSASLRRETNRGTLTLIGILPWSERGVRQASVDEAFALTGNSLYNPAWGMIDGRPRTSRVATALTPEALVSWRHRLTTNTTMYAVANLRFSAEGFTSLGWYDAPTPSPDNYRHLPSYFDEESAEQAVVQSWHNNDLRYTQIDWQRLIDINRSNRHGEAHYAIESRCVNLTRGGGGIRLVSDFGRLRFDYGALFDYHSERNFKRMHNLLGADHLTDIDYFVDDYKTYTKGNQNDLRNPDRTIRRGDRFGYDYRLTRWRATLYANMVWHYNTGHITAGIRVASSKSYRRGYYEKELFAEAGSYGRSRSIVHNPYSLLVAWEHHIGEHRHSLGARMALQGEEQSLDALFVQELYNNRLSGLSPLVKTFGAEAHYTYSSARFRLLATLYTLLRYDIGEVSHHYDDLAREYVDVIMEDIRQLHYGLEVAAEIRYSRRFASQFALRIGQHTYRGEARLTLLADDDNSTIATTHAALRGLRLAPPAIALYGNVAYRSLNGWGAQIALRYLGMRYAEPSLLRRSDYITTLCSTDAERDILTAQRRLPDVVTIDASISKHLKIAKTTLLVALNVENLLGTRYIVQAIESDRMHLNNIAGRIAPTPHADRLLYDYPQSIRLSATLYF